MWLPAFNEITLKGSNELYFFTAGKEHIKYLQTKIEPNKMSKYVERYVEVTVVDSFILEFENMFFSYISPNSVFRSNQFSGLFIYFSASFWCGKVFVFFFWLFFFIPSKNKA